MPVKSNWIHCRIFDFSEQTHHFLREQKPLPPGIGWELVWPQAGPIGWARFGSLAALGAAGRRRSVLLLCGVA